MKRVFRFSGFLVLLSLLCGKAYGQLQTIAHYKLGEAGSITYQAAPDNLKDYSKNKFNLQKQGDPLFFADGPHTNTTAGSVLFNGKTDGYGIKKALVTANENFALEAWVKASTEKHGDSHGLTIHAVVANGDGKGGYVMAQRNDKWVALVGGVNVFPMGQVIPERWTHLALVADGNNCSLFMDGKKVGDFQRTKMVSPNFSIANMGEGQEAFHGKVFEVRLSQFKKGKFDPQKHFLLDYKALKKKAKEDIQKQKALISSLKQSQKGIELVKEFQELPVGKDWLVTPVKQSAKLQVKITDDNTSASLLLSNGLISREFFVSENLACVSLKNLRNDAQFLRAVKPEAKVRIDSMWYEVGGMTGQPEKSYLLEEWYGDLEANPEAFHFVGLETSDPIKRYPWHKKYNAADTDWPPRGLHVAMHYDAPAAICENHKGIQITVHYEIYEGLPVVAKWLTLENESGKDIVIDESHSEVLAVCQDQRERMHVESDYSFALVNAHPEGSALIHYTGGAPSAFQAGRSTTLWTVDQEYNTWATQNQAEDLFMGFKHKCLLISRPPVGPGEHLPSGEEFISFITFELLQDSDDKERQSLAHRQFYRKLAPQVTESLLGAAITSQDTDHLKKFIDQMDELGFERLDIHPWPGIAHDKLDADYIDHWKEIASYAQAKGIIMGGYELIIASRGRGKDVNVVDYKTGKPGSPFGQSVCVASKWYDDYFARMWKFYDQTGFKSFNMDGPYHGDVCASHNHKYHSGLYDSQWQQWKKMVEVLHELQERDVFIPIPDWYFLNGQCATGMGYREASANLTPQQQLLLNRQYIYDGTWHKSPTMGWMSLQLVGFYTNDPRVGLEPLKDNLDRYERGLVQHLGSGCQFSVRGNRLYDTPETKGMVKKWIDWFKKYRTILTSDIIHLGRPTGRDIDCMFHVNSQAEYKGLAIVFNPTNRKIKKDLELPLYYTGLTDKAMIREKEGEAKEYKLDREYKVKVTIEIPANGFTWLVVE